MPEFNLPNLQDLDKDELVNIVAKMNKTLSWLLSNLDSLNVTEINTNLTRVASQDGETIINGPLLQMYDKQATPMLRLQQGYNASTGDFVFQMFNKLGQLMMDLDSNGNALFQGVVRTAASGRRIEISGNSLFAFDANQIARIEYRPTTSVQGLEYYEIWFRDQNGVQTGVLNSIDGLFSIGSMRNMIIGTNPGYTTYFSGGAAVDFQNNVVKFNNATVQGLTTTINGSHNHGIPDGTVLLVSGGGTVTFRQSGDHAHNVE